jgi:hypothetical protein
MAIWYIFATFWYCVKKNLATLGNGKSYALIVAKIALGHILVDFFPQTHPVTLCEAHEKNRRHEITTDRPMRTDLPSAAKKHKTKKRWKCQK